MMTKQTPYMKRQILQQRKTATEEPPWKCQEKSTEVGGGLGAETSLLARNFNLNSDYVRAALKSSTSSVKHRSETHRIKTTAM